MDLKKPSLAFSAGLLLWAFLFVPASQAQNQNAYSRGVLSRAPAGLIHIAEVGTLVDTVNVWGSVGRTGRYVIPRHLTIPQLISYAGGVSTGRRNNQQLDWVNNKISVLINRYVPGRGNVEIKKFRSDYDEALPPELFQYKLQNEDIVTVEVKRKPNFWDYLGRAAPIIGIVTSAVILLDRF